LVSVLPTVNTRFTVGRCPRPRAHNPHNVVNVGFPRRTEVSQPLIPGMWRTQSWPL